jgi:aquaporin Z
MGRDELQRGFAEFVGTFTLIFVGAGSIIATGGGNLTAIALAHGLAIGVMVSAVGHISGGHFNPAITLGFLVTKRIEARLAAVYWFAQFTGALIAALLLRGLLPGRLDDAVNLGAPGLGFGISGGQGLVIEIILTFFLVWVVFATAADPRGSFQSIAGLAIGFTITLDIFIGGPFTGAAMNPARAFGPQLVQDFWADGWVWYLGPLIGAAAAALAYDRLYLRPVGPEPVGPPETGLEEPGAGRTATS